MSFVDVLADTRACNDVLLSHFQKPKKTTKKKRQPVKVAIGDRGHKKFSPTIVRAAPFYQSFYGCLGTLSTGTLYYPLEDKELTHVDYNDVGKAIATILQSPEGHGGKAYNIIGESQSGAMIAGNITMKAGVQCAYENVADEVAVAAFEALGLQSWLAKGNVEMLKFSRIDGFKKYGAGDFKALTGSNPKRFGDFVKESLKPLLTDA